jgi:hypothetical protein
MAELKRDNLITWLESEALKHGTVNQRERWAAKLLPEDELTALARKEIFSPFESLKRWRNLSQREADLAIKHNDACQLQAPVTFVSLDDVDFLTADEWKVYKLVQACVDATMGAHSWCTDGGCEVSFKLGGHLATCTVCNKAIRFATAMVTVQWAGRTLTREYTLTDVGAA